MSTFTTSYNTSCNLFETMVWPTVSNYFAPGARCHSLETTGTPIDVLDTKVCIDALIISPDVVYSIASRVQYVDKPWDTFTIRCFRSNGARTELDKLEAAIEREAMYPTFFCQAYLSKDKKTLLSLAVVRTVDLIRACKTADTRMTRDSNGDEQHFRVVKWSDLEASGADIQVWRA